MPPPARVLAWSSLALLLFTAPASAIQVPSPTASSVAAILVGNSIGLRIGTGFKVTVRDASFNPIANSVVQILFANVVHPYTAQVPPATVVCPVISKPTDINGLVVFDARFGGFSNTNTIQVKADGVFLRAVQARSTDMDGNGATDAFDFVQFRTAFLNNPTTALQGVDQSGTVDLGDFDIFRQVFLHDTPGTACP